MSKLKCICGNGMSNSDVPSENIISVFRETNVKHAFEKTPKVSLFDFETSNSDGYEYWYCPNCKRVHVVENVPNGLVVKRYHPSDCEEIVSIADMKPLYVFSAIEIYDAEEKNFEMTLEDFIEQNGGSHLYYADNNVEKIYKKINGTKGSLVYEIEK